MFDGRFRDREPESLSDEEWRDIEAAVTAYKASIFAVCTWSDGMKWLRSMSLASAGIAKLPQPRPLGNRKRVSSTMKH